MSMRMHPELLAALLAASAVGDPAGRGAGLMTDHGYEPTLPRQKNRSRRHKKNPGKHKWIRQPGKPVK